MCYWEVTVRNLQPGHSPLLSEMERCTSDFFRAAAQKTEQRHTGGVEGKAMLQGCLSFMYKNYVVYSLNPKISSVASGV